MGRWARPLPVDTCGAEKEVQGNGGGRRVRISTEEPHPQRTRATNEGIHQNLCYCFIKPGQETQWSLGIFAFGVWALGKKTGQA